MDLSHNFGQDLTLSPSGDLATVTDATEDLQHILRRLLTNPGAYIWHVEYGAGLGRFIGLPAAQQRIAAVIQRQMLSEAAVQQNPPPTVNVAVQTNGVVTATIAYTDAVTGTPQNITVPIGG